MALETVRLGTTGLSVSELPFGTWRFGRETEEGNIEIREGAAYDLLDAYEEHGGNFIDTADVYGGGDSETWIGNWLADRDREDFVIASKIYWPTREGDPNGRGLGRKHVRRQIDLMLDRLGTSYIDLLYIHRWDDQTPARELMRTLDGLVDAGKVNYLGASTMEPNAWRVVQANEVAERHGWEPFSVTQPRYNLINREIESQYLPMCREYGLGVCTWSPLAAGFLTGKHTREGDVDEDSRAAEGSRFRRRYLTEENFRVLDEVRAVADEVDASPAQVALAWQRYREGITGPILGARTVDQLEENLGAADVELNDDQVERLTAARPGEVED